MRQAVEEQIRGRKLPLIMAHKGGTVYGRENSLQAVKKAIVIMPDVVIEVDIRKSRDGVLYCHHGSVPFGVSIATLFGFLTFAQIQKLVGPRDTLESIINHTPPPTILYLDIKDRAVTAEDLKRVIGTRRNVWIAPLTTMKHLVELRAGLGEEFAYAYNRPVFFPRRMLKRLGDRTDFLQSFWWNWNEKIIREIEDGGSIYHLCEWFISRKKYIASMPRSRYKGLFFSIYDLADAAELNESAR